MTRYVNTTPHAINILAGSGLNQGQADITIASSNVSIRVKSESEVALPDHSRAHSDGGDS